MLVNTLKSPRDRVSTAGSDVLAVKRNMKIITNTELTSSGFIRETSHQVRGTFSIDTATLLDPYPDAYKVFMKKVVVKPLRKKSPDIETKEWVIARPMNGHIPMGGYDLLTDDGTMQHYDTFDLARHDLSVLVESFVNSLILAGEVCNV